MKKRWVFDIEIFPNFFSVIFISLDKKDKRVFVIYKDRNDLNSLITFLLTECEYIIGYNNEHYDNLILNWFIENQEKINREEWSVKAITVMLYRLSQDIINDTLIFDDRRLRWKKFYKWIDMKKLLKLDKSLKLVAILLKWHRIQDLPLHYTHIVMNGDVDDILMYNENDVLITLELVKRAIELLQLRQLVGKRYGIDVMTQSKSGIANILFAKFYEERSGIPYDTFKHQRTTRASVKFADCILPNIRFSSLYLQTFLKKVSKIDTHIEKGCWEEKIKIKGKEYQVGIGGLHSIDKAGLYESNEEYEIIDFDVQSFYPAIMIEYGIKPEHLTEDFSKILTQVRDDRIKAKKAKQKVEAETLKICINSVFGKTGDQYSWIFDNKAMLSVTLNGQLFLLMLIERFNETNIEVISANT